MRYIVMCLMEDGLYVQVTSRHFEFEIDALQYSYGIARSRHPVVVSISTDTSDAALQLRNKHYG